MADIAREVAMTQQRMQMVGLSGMLQGQNAPSPLPPLPPMPPLMPMANPAWHAASSNPSQPRPASPPRPVSPPAAAWAIDPSAAESAQGPGIFTFVNGTPGILPQTPPRPAAQAASRGCQRPAGSRRVRPRTIADQGEEAQVQAPRGATEDEDIRPRGRRRPRQVPSTNDDGDEEELDGADPQSGNPNAVAPIPMPDNDKNVLYKQDRNKKQIGHDGDKIKYESPPTPVNFYTTEGPRRMLKPALFFGVLTYMPMIGSLSAQSENTYALYDDRLPLTGLSITVEIVKEDCPRGWLDMMYDFMRLFAVAGIAALERGRKGDSKHLHVQATIIN